MRDYGRDTLSVPADSDLKAKMSSRANIIYAAGAGAAALAAHTLYRRWMRRHRCPPLQAHAEAGPPAEREGTSDMQIAEQQPSTDRTP